MKNKSVMLTEQTHETLYKLKIEWKLKRIEDVILKLLDEVVE